MKINDLPDYNEETLKVLPLDLSETIPASWYTDEKYFFMIKKKY